MPTGSDMEMTDLMDQNKSNNYRDQNNDPEIGVFQFRFN